MISVITSKLGKKTANLHVYLVFLPIKMLYLIKKDTENANSEKWPQSFKNMKYNLFEEKFKG